ncbi:MAG: hypothetical protein HONBIEJF_00807 [Fimbriimonadaceae bacterium]|nr:hypothetical protein [Fimbriimonadaceae bacterium]
MGVTCQLFRIGGDRFDKVRPLVSQLHKERIAGHSAVGSEVGMPHGNSKPDNPGDILGPSSQLTLLTTSRNERLDRRTSTNGKGSDSLRATDLVSADGDEVGFELRAPCVRSRGLHGIDEMIGSMLTASRSHGDHVRDRANLVVGVHGADEQHVVLHPILELVKPRSSERVDVDPLDPHPDTFKDRHGAKNRLMLGTRDENAEAVGRGSQGDAKYCRYCCLGSTRSEDNFSERAPKSISHRFAGRIDCRAGSTAGGMKAAGVSKLVAHPRLHRCHDLGQHRGCRGVVEEQPVHAKSMANGPFDACGGIPSPVIDSAVEAPLSMEIQEVMSYLPHRYPMLLVDRMLEVIPGKRTRAVKNVTINESFFQGHYPGRPIMPGVLIIEAMAQAGCVMLLMDPQYRDSIPVIGAIDEVKFKRQVIPGDQLVTDCELLWIKSSIGRIKAQATVGGQLAAQMELTFKLMPKE